MKKSSLDVITGKITISEIPQEEINKEIEENKKAFNSLHWNEKRLAEYPSIEQLVVAIYDADDRAEIDKKRAEIKKKYPKPE